MKRMIFAAIVITLLAAQTVSAHPPSNIQLSYDKYTKTLKIKISHAVTDPRSHYIKDVTVAINGDIALTHTLKMQDTDTSQFLQYSLPDAKSRDRIRVQAHCSSFGKRLKEMTIK